MKSQILPFYSLSQRPTGIYESPSRSSHGFSWKVWHSRCCGFQKYRLWLKVLSFYLQDLVICPERGVSLFAWFRRFRDCICVTDCSEIFTERPQDLTARTQAWSSYKNNNTCKYWIGIKPAAAALFLSRGWEAEAATNKQWTLDFLKNITMGDCIMADRGYLSEDELHGRGAVSKIPRFTRGTNQWPAKEVDESSQLADVRTDVEKVIGRSKDSRLLQTVIPVTQVELLDNVMTAICGATNLLSVSKTILYSLQYLFIIFSLIQL